MVFLAYIMHQWKILTEKELEEYAEQFMSSGESDDDDFEFIIPLGFLIIMILLKLIIMR